MRFLFIDSEYVEEEFSDVRDEVIANWDKFNDKFILKVFIGGDLEYIKSNPR